MLGSFYPLWKKTRGRLYFWFTCDCYRTKIHFHNPRSTVGTVTEIHDYLRLLFARVGTAYCPEHQISLEAQTYDQMALQILHWPQDEKIMILSPVVRERKGTHEHLIQDLLSRGFLRAVIDGIMTDLDSVDTLDKAKAHNISVVIDRLKLKADCKSRLVESLESACSLSEGLVTVSSFDNAKLSSTFSSKHACPECGYSVPDLEPRMFSFNSPIGACDVCDGLGSLQLFDVDKVVWDPELSLADGAIRLSGWDCSSNFYHGMLKAIAEHYDFSLHTPWQDLPHTIQDIVLYGSGKEKIDFELPGFKGSTRRYKKPFEGIINNIDRRYKETDSDAMRQDLSKYLTDQPCPSCSGTRLNKSARNVRIDDKNIGFWMLTPVHALLEYAEKLSFPVLNQRYLIQLLKKFQQD